MDIKQFYHGHKCAEIFGETVCRFDDSQYDVIETDYGFEVNKVV